MTDLSFDIYIRATPERLWAALIDPAITPRYRFGLSFQSDWRPGSPLTSQSPAGEGIVQEATPGRRLVYSWSETGRPDANGGHPSTVSFDLTPMGQTTRLAVLHSDLAPDGPFLKIVEPGWPMILSGLKSLLETGEPLIFGGS